MNLYLSNKLFKEIQHEKDFYNLPRTSFSINHIFQKSIIKINNSKIFFITYCPNIKYMNTKFKKVIIFKKKKKYKNKQVDNFIFYNADHLFIDFLSTYDEVSLFLNSRCEDFCEGIGNDIFYNIHQSLLICANLIEFSPIYYMFCSKLLHLCNKLYKINGIDKKNNKYLKDYAQITGKDKLLENSIKKEGILNHKDFFNDQFEEIVSDFIFNMRQLLQNIENIFITQTPNIVNLKLPCYSTKLSYKTVYEKYEPTFKSRLKIDNTVITYNLDNLEDFFNVYIKHVLETPKKYILKCKNCNNYYISEKPDSKYCSWPSPQNKKKSCRQIRNHLNQRQLEQDKIIQCLYDTIYNKFYDKTKSKNKEIQIKYNSKLEKFKESYNKNKREIVYYEFTRKKMIDWLNSIISNPDTIDEISSSNIDSHSLEKFLSSIS